LIKEIERGREKKQNHKKENFFFRVPRTRRPTTVGIRARKNSPETSTGVHPVFREGKKRGKEEREEKRKMRDFEGR